jgi:hypothetical protein
MVSGNFTRTLHIILPLSTRTMRSLVPVVLAILAPALVLWRLIFGGEVLYWGVPLTQFYPWQTLINQALASGQLPLWTDLLGNGAPLLANHQTALFYPPNLLFRFLPVEHALGYSVVLHIMGAGLAALYWGRTLGLGWTGRLVLALSYALGGYVMGRTQFITMVAAYAWLPLLLALTERLVRQRNRLSVVWLGSALALQFLAGHAQTWFYSLLLLVAYGIYRAFQSRARPIVIASSVTDVDAAARAGSPYRILIEAVGRLAMATVLALALSAVQLLPTAELAMHSQRRDGVEYDFALTYSYWPWRLLTLLAPDLFGNPAAGNYAGYATYWEDHAYIGVLPLLFVLSALLSSWRSARRHTDSDHLLPPDHWPVPFFGALLPVAVVLAMGNYTPVFPLLFRYVPGFGFFQAPARLMLWFAIGASTLAGIGAHSFRLTYRKQYVLRLTVAGAAAMFGVAMAMNASGLNLGRLYAPALVRLAIWLGLAAVMLLLFGRSPGDLDLRVKASPLPRAIWGLLVAVIIGADLGLAAAPLTPTIVAAMYHPSTHQIVAPAGPLRLHVDPDYQYAMFFQRYFTFDRFGPPDITHWQELRASPLPNLNAVDGIAATGNYDPLVVERWRSLMEQTRRSDWATTLRLLRLMNVGLVLTDRRDTGLSQVGARPDLYRLPAPLPRAWLVSSAEVITDTDRLMQRLVDPTFDPRTTVLIESPVQLDWRGSSGVPAEAGDILALHEGWNRRTIRFVGARPAFLVVTYTHYPGWQATLDGQPISILRANYAFSAVPVPGGRHELVLEYRPASLTAGGVTTALALLVVVGVLATQRRSTQRAPATQPRG